MPTKVLDRKRKVKLKSRKELMMFTIEEVKDEDQKMAVVAEILRDLPEWFGLPTGQNSRRRFK